MSIRTCACMQLSALYSGLRQSFQDPSLSRIFDKCMVVGGEVMPCSVCKSTRQDGQSACIAVFDSAGVSRVTKPSVLFHNAFLAQCGHGQHL